MLTHSHPVSGATILGTRLAPGSEIRADDVYDSSDGKWRTCSHVVANKLQPGCTTIWVRQTPLSDDARTLLGYLNQGVWGSKNTCIGERNDSFFVIPSPTFNWDGRFDIYSKQVAHPECVQELVDHGYLVLGKYNIHRSESDYAACELYGTNRAYTLTDEGRQKGKEILAN